jgi:hypothetical protein
MVEEIFVSAQKVLRTLEKNPDAGKVWALREFYAARIWPGYNG